MRTVSSSRSPKNVRAPGRSGGGGGESGGEDDGEGGSEGSGEAGDDGGDDVGDDGGGADGGECGGEGGDAWSVTAPLVALASTSTTAPAALAAALPHLLISAASKSGTTPPAHDVSGMTAVTTTEPGRSVRSTEDASTPRSAARLSLNA